MKKKESTSDPAFVSGTLKTAFVRRFGTNPAAAAEPIPFPYYLCWDRLGRRGQRCKIIRRTPQTVQVEFEDGFKSVISRQAIRQFKP